jgi:hypothetical protein
MRPEVVELKTQLKTYTSRVFGFHNGHFETLGLAEEQAKTLAREWGGTASASTDSSNALWHVKLDFAQADAFVERMQLERGVDRFR